jgi:hypothetical protein
MIAINMYDTLNKAQHEEELGYRLTLDIDYYRLNKEFRLKLKYR